MIGQEEAVGGQMGGAGRLGYGLEAALIGVQVRQDCGLAVVLISVEAADLTRLGSGLGERAEAALLDAQLASHGGQGAGRWSRPVWLGLARLGGLGGFAGLRFRDPGREAIIVHAPPGPASRPPPGPAAGFEHTMPL